MQRKYKVALTYFKPTGKYYSEGEYISHKEFIWEIQQEVYELLRDGVRPGLVSVPPGANEFYTVIEVPGHPHDHPRLIKPSMMRCDDAA